VAVVGPTGSGKTTLLRALLGLEPSATGIVRYGADDLTHRGVGPSERPFAWVAQDAPIIAGSLEENVTLFGAACYAGLLAAGSDWGAINKIAHEWRTFGWGDRAVVSGSSANGSRWPEPATGHQCPCWTSRRLASTRVAALVLERCKLRHRTIGEGPRRGGGPIG
jgi:energy-coupling factor transporter ATP-binding protein EcfA2